MKADHSGGPVAISSRSAFRFFKQYRTVALFGLFFGILLYWLMMSQQLTNTFDGLWQQNYHYAGTTELTSGRWLLLFVDKLLMGLHGEPVASVAALILFIAGFLLILDLFQVKSRLSSCLCMALFLSSTLISNTLSYRFTSLGYALACLLAVLSVYTVVKVRNRVAAMVLSGVLLGLAMSCYQAYLAVFCIVALFYLLFLCGRSVAAAPDPDKTVLRTLLRLVCALVIGALFYLVSLRLMLTLYRTALSGYNGIGGISPGTLLTGLPRGVLRTYRAFGAYFFQDVLKVSVLQSFGISYLLLALFLATLIVIWLKVWRVKKPLLILLILAAVAAPVACNAYMLLAGDKLELQMTAGLAMFVPLTCLLAFSHFDGKHITKSICALLCVVLLYGSAMQVWIDQQAMYEGQNACETMVTQVIADLRQEDLLSSDYEYFFVGVPSENPFFSVSGNYRRANGYAQMGNFWVSGNCCHMSYRGLIQKRMGFDLPISNLRYEALLEKHNVPEMAEFPYDGYLALVDDHTVVIKMGEYKPYAGQSKYVFAP